MAPLTHQSLLLKLHVDRFNRFCRDHPFAPYTGRDTKTTLRATFVVIGRIYAAYAMWPKREMCHSLTFINQIKSCLPVTITATDLNSTIPFCHVRQACDRNYPKFHTLTVPARGNTACGFQSTHQ